MPVLKRQLCRQCQDFPEWSSAGKMQNEPSSRLVHIISPLFCQLVMLRYIHNFPFCFAMDRIQCDLYLSYEYHHLSCYCRHRGFVVYYPAEPPSLSFDYCQTYFLFPRKLFQMLYQCLLTFSELICYLRP